MKFDPKFTAKLQEWMNTPDEKKDWAEGAVMLLQLSGNQLMYRNISLNPKGKAEFIKGKLQKYLNYRLQQLTHNEVEEMQKQVDVIAQEVIKPAANTEGKSSEFAEFKAGKRADHDTLPDEIKALYAENLDIVHRMRELHLKLRSLSLNNATCPDSERYPFLKEIIALDKKLHDNWDTYDHYVVRTSSPASDGSPVEADIDSVDGGHIEEESTSEEEETPVIATATVPEASAEGQEPAETAPAEVKPKKAKTTTKRTTKKAAKK